MDTYMHLWNGGMGMGLGFPALLIPLFIMAMVWSFMWKGLALWHSAQKHEIGWFLVFLVVNTLGILEMVYLFGFRGMKLGELFTSHHHESKP